MISSMPNRLSKLFQSARRRAVAQDQSAPNQLWCRSGGPVYIPKVYNGRNKTFFLFNYEGRRRSQPGAISTSLVPTNQFRTGDFSQLLNRMSASGAALPPVLIVDPTVSNPDNPTPFPGNIIPAGRIGGGQGASGLYSDRSECTQRSPYGSELSILRSIRSTITNTSFAATTRFR